VAFERRDSACRKSGDGSQQVAQLLRGSYVEFRVSAAAMLRRESIFLFFCP
jgi:hypothetical protein